MFLQFRYWSVKLKSHTTRRKRGLKIGTVFIQKTD